jgi:hypothetical protein
MWSAHAARDWDSFQLRLKADELRLAEQDVNFRPDSAPPIVAAPPLPSGN